ncbi:hypothetical protein OO184_10870 [Photorhabdus sp. APURE]|uniref:hypothetical protein n=1 Tax=Photorhabdus aballayi TaxID=2991723 RepID=UPI00223E37E2|nr:hypothetical protein [Photorhabdus aballayi]MCW7548430.1 hypothetical protein [Photorhabdus aballayi]
MINFATQGKQQGIISKDAIYKYRGLKMSTKIKFATECKAEQIRYLSQAKIYRRGSEMRKMYVSLAWRNRNNARQWLSVN